MAFNLLPISGLKMKNRNVSFRVFFPLNIRTVSCIRPPDSDGGGGPVRADSSGPGRLLGHGPHPGGAHPRALRRAGGDALQRMEGRPVDQREVLLLVLLLLHHVHTVPQVDHVVVVVSILGFPVVVVVREAEGPQVAGVDVGVRAGVVAGGEVGSCEGERRRTEEDAGGEEEADEAKEAAAAAAAAAARRRGRRGSLRAILGVLSCFF